MIRSTLYHGPSAAAGFYKTALDHVGGSQLASQLLRKSWRTTATPASLVSGIVRQRIGEVKTVYSQRKLSIDAGILNVLQAWKQTTGFKEGEDGVFASPTKAGRLPWSYDQVWRMFLRAAERAEIGRLGTHSMRHTYRSWLDSVGTPIAVQQKLMRHADIRTTMNIYGDVVTDEMSQAHSRPSVWR